MGKPDIVTKAYMRKSNIFADAFNYLIYNGRKVINPEKLTEVDSTEIAISFGAKKERKEAKEITEMTEDPVQKYRDILKTAAVMQESETYYLLLGIENQTDIHYAMPVRNMIYDALQYGKQVTDTAASIISLPKHYLEKIGYDNDRDRNQIANFTYLDYTTNIDISDEAPAEYVCRYREKLGEEGYRLACAQNALPENFEQLSYPEFLKQRRLLMAQIVKKAYNELDK